VTVVVVVEERKKRGGGEEEDTKQIEHTYYRYRVLWTSMCVFAYTYVVVWCWLHGWWLVLREEEETTSPWRQRQTRMKAKRSAERVCSWYE
jgi:hypothetical protein